MDRQAHPSRTRSLLMMGAGLASGLAWPWLQHQPMWLPGMLICALGLGDWLFPRRLAPLWRTLEKAGKAVAHGNSLILLSLIYFLIITPAGLLLQWKSRPRAGGGATASFYERPDEREPDHMQRMF